MCPGTSLTAGGAEVLQSGGLLPYNRADNHAWIWCHGSRSDWWKRHGDGQWSVQQRYNTKDPQLGFHRHKSTSHVQFADEQVNN